MRPVRRGRIATVGLDSPFLSARVAGADARFLGLLASAVDRIPPGIPPIRTLERVSLRRRGDLPGLVGLTTWAERPRGRVLAGGRQTLTFYSELLDRVSDAASLAVVAHELAHAWLNEHAEPEDSVAREREADELARRWGFGRELDALEAETEPA